MSKQRMSYARQGKCPRCSKMAYDGEAKKIEGDLFYHPLCFQCLNCKKGLQLIDYNLRKETDKDKPAREIYCGACYASLFGPKGFRGGTGGGVGMMGPGVSGSIAGGNKAESPKKPEEAAKPGYRKKDPCFSWIDTGACAHGDSCLFAHNS
eukprot:gb/GEZN01018666.1/.p1 GENE.gb/GEZN01018666.1/~~gb/GEZN01018666.1/.p1  ORF type:complete len:151 (+),score=23.74 gb/GEZN01018666.1/:70-522(+)